MKLRTAVIAAATACSLGLTSSAAQTASEPGEGVLCALAIYSYIDQLGQRCHAGEDPEFQAAMRAAVADLDAYVLKNSDATTYDLETFKRNQQATADVPDEQFCSGEAAGMYGEFARSDLNKLKAGVAEVTERPGPPRWGTCL